MSIIIHKKPLWPKARKAFRTYEAIIKQQSSALDAHQEEIEKLSGYRDVLRKTVEQLQDEVWRLSRENNKLQEEIARVQ